MTARSADNPFVGQSGKRPEVYTLQTAVAGLAVHPYGEMWENENGPNGGDEINIQANYGWLVVSYGRDYPGP